MQNISPRFLSRLSLSFVAAAVVLISGGSKSQAALQCANYDLAENGRRAPEMNATIDVPGKIRVKDQTISYVSRSGYMPITIGDPKAEKPITACLFYVAYEMDLPPGQSRVARPLTFLFNGGPGSSSSWVHVGGLGPRRLDTGQDGLKLAPPMILIDNPWTLLDLSDLVFIDPINTGYSKPSGSSVASDFNGVKRDAISVGEFIRLFLRFNGRFVSPLYILGESYGGNRASELASYLQNSMGANLNGVILISPTLNAATDRYVSGNDIPYVASLPSFATAAQFHKKLAPELEAKTPEALFGEVVKFARGVYLQSLIDGGTEDPAERREVIRKVAYYTGLSEEFVETKNLRVGVDDFLSELLRGEGAILGDLDSRVSGQAHQSVANDPDPASYSDSYSEVTDPVFNPVVHYYLRHELQIKTSLFYVETTDPESWPNDDPDPQGDTSFGSYIDTTKNIRQAMLTNKNLGLFVAGGYYDLSVPIAGLAYALNQIGGPELQSRIERHYYKSGHPVYITENAAEPFKNALVKFYAKTAHPAYIPTEPAEEALP